MTAETLQVPTRAEHIAEVCEIDSRASHSDDELVAIFRRCHKYASRRLPVVEDAQDFATWALIAVMDGHAVNCQWLFSTYHRQMLGRVGSKNNEVRKAIHSGVSLDTPVSEDLSATLSDCIPAPEIESPDRELEDLAYVGLPRRTQKIVDMLHDGCSSKEIARAHHKSETWVWLQLAHWRLAVAKIGLSRLRETAPDNISIDTRLEVDWITIS